MDEDNEETRRASQPLAAYLKDVAVKVAAGERIEVRIRELLGRVPAERRGTRVTTRIQEALEHEGLVSVPSFATGWIDSMVELRLASAASEPPTQSGAETTRPQSSDATSTLTVSSLESAASSVIGVERTNDLDLARSRMLRHDFSQLAVMSNPRQLVGAVTWESIAIATLREEDLTLTGAIIPATAVRLDDDLIALIPTIIAQGFVFVEAKDRTLGGIVTTADLSNQFATLARPFLLIGEIERRLRAVISRCFEMADLVAVRDPEDNARSVESADDLTLGEVGRLIENPDRWLKLRWPLDRKEFVEAFDEIRDIRNDVMHFSPDPLSSRQDEALLNFVNWLKVMMPPG